VRQVQETLRKEELVVDQTEGLQVQGQSTSEGGASGSVSGTPVLDASDPTRRA